jgi:putative phosphoesterase
MLVVCSDTHGIDGPRLTGRTREAVAAADLVVHAGDFTTPAALDGFRAAAARLVAVHGNADTSAVTSRLPPAATTTYAGVPVAVTHTERGGETALSLFGRQRGAALVVSGHTHRPSVDVPEAGPTLLNPGSHADPRGNRAAHAELWAPGEEVVPDSVDRRDDDADLVGAIRTPGGDVVDEFGVTAVA